MSEKRRRKGNIDAEILQEATLGLMEAAELSDTHSVKIALDEYDKYFALMTEFKKEVLERHAGKQEEAVCPERSDETVSEKEEDVPAPHMEEQTEETAGLQEDPESERQSGETTFPAEREDIVPVLKPAETADGQDDLFKYKSAVESLLAAVRDLAETCQVLNGA